MLIELNVQNFAVIERLRLELGPGFNVLTGETGAGKSILIDAVSGLPGARLGAEAVRAGEQGARVEGVFEVDAGDPELRAVLEELGVEPEEGTLIESRDVAGTTDLLQCQRDEIAAATVQPGEDDHLGAERQVLANAERLIELAEGAYAALYEGADEVCPATELLGQAADALTELARLDAA